MLVFRSRIRSRFNQNSRRFNHFGDRHAPNNRQSQLMMAKCVGMPWNAKLESARPVAVLIHSWMERWRDMKMSEEAIIHLRLFHFLRR